MRMTDFESGPLRPNRPDDWLGWERYYEDMARFARSAGHYDYANTWSELAYQAMREHPFDDWGGFGFEEPEPTC
jgi:hypothetical protein